MKQRIEALKQRFEAYSLRERALISLALIVVIYLLWDMLLMNQEGVAQRKIVGQMYSINQQMEALNTQIDLLTASLTGGEAAQMKARVGELQGLLQDIAQQEQDLTVQFIRPEQMAGVLREILAKNNQLVLIRLSNLGVEPLFAEDSPSREAAATSVPSAAPGTAAQQATPRAEIYRHGMEVVFEGDFGSTVQYLQALENMPWRFYWDNVEYQVLQYPKARVVIRLHTLSLDKEWIGV